MAQQRGTRNNGRGVTNVVTNRKSREAKDIHYIGEWRRDPLRTPHQKLECSPFHPLLALPSIKKIFRVSNLICDSMCVCCTLTPHQLISSFLLSSIFSPS